MIKDVIEDKNYRTLMESQIFEVIEYLINNDQEFSITANIKGVTFDPPMPESISSQFSQFTLFSLMNYTFESIVMTESKLTFEAGFGQENFGSQVTVPLYAIFQIVLDESILFINPTATVPTNFIEEIEEKVEEQDQRARSMNAFKLNKNNKDLF